MADVISLREFAEARRERQRLAAEEERTRWGDSSKWNTLLIDARKNGVSAVGELVCTLPINWTGRTDFYRLTAEELREVGRRRSAMVRDGISEDMIILITGLGRTSVRKIAKTGIIKLIGTRPDPNLFYPGRTEDSQWPRIYSKSAFLDVYLHGVLDRFIEGWKTRNAFKRKGLRVVGGAR
jgi:hypothetical protein